MKIRGIIETSKRINQALDSIVENMRLQCNLDAGMVDSYINQDDYCK